MHGSVQVRELAAWGLDAYAYRPQSACKNHDYHAAPRTPFLQRNPLLPLEQIPDAATLEPHAKRLDLLHEMRGLEWSLRVVDLRCLLTFQRRLSIDPAAPPQTPPAPADWPALVEYAFGRPRSIAYETIVATATQVIVRSRDPNLQMACAPDEPLQLYGGSPFFEVAEFRGRWFLRDGYHRAFQLLRQGIVFSPAVVVRAKTLAELGAAQPWFFPEEVLFSPDPPLVTDFLDDSLNLVYTRPALIKTLRVTIEESFAPLPEAGEPS